MPVVDCWTDDGFWDVLVLLETAESEKPPGKNFIKMTTTTIIITKQRVATTEIIAVRGELYFWFNEIKSPFKIYYILNNTDIIIAYVPLIYKE